MTCTDPPDWRAVLGRRYLESDSRTEDGEYVPLPEPDRIELGQTWTRVFRWPGYDGGVDNWSHSVVVRHVGGSLWELAIGSMGQPLRSTTSMGCDFAGIMTEAHIRANAVYRGDCVWFLEALGCQEHPGCRLSPEVARDCWLSRRPGAP